MSRILVAVSSLYAAERVVETLVDLARRLAAEVLVVHVSRPSGGQMREEEQAEGEVAIRFLRGVDVPVDHRLYEPPGWWMP